MKEILTWYNLTMHLSVVQVLLDATLMKLYWECELLKTRINVYFNDELKGYYPLLRSPFCTRCSNPYVTEDECNFHLKDKLERTYAIGVYSRHSEDLLSEHIRQLKYWKNKARPLGTAMALCLEQLYKIQGIDIFVPVPLYELKPDRSTERRYNQAEELAKQLSATLKQSIAVVDILKVIKDDKMHKTSTYNERWTVSKDMYVCTDKDAVKGKAILLIDDVRTSGATGTACAKALLDAGASKVSLFVAGINKYEELDNSQEEQESC